MKRIKFNYLTKEQKLFVQVIYISPDNDVVHDIYMKLDNMDMFRACHDTLLTLGYYGISFFVKDSFGEYTLKVVS